MFRKKSKLIIEEEIHLLEDQHFSNDVSFKQKNFERRFSVTLKPSLDEGDTTPKLLPSQKKKIMKILLLSYYQIFRILQK